MDVYFYQADIYCAGCAKLHIESCKNEDNGDSDTYPQGPYSDGGGEADSPQHCADCGGFLNNPLTDDGYRYVCDLLIKEGWHYDSDGQKVAYIKGVLQDWQEYYNFCFIDGSWSTPECDVEQIMNISENYLNRVKDDWQRIVLDEALELQDVCGTIYAFTSELAALRLFRYYNLVSFNPKAAMGYSIARESYYFRLETQ